MKGAYSGCTTPPRLPVTVGVPESQVERSRRFRQPLPPAGPCRLPPVRVGVSGRATQQPSVPPRPSDRDDPSNVTGRRCASAGRRYEGSSGIAPRPQWRAAPSSTLLYQLGVQQLRDQFNRDVGSASTRESIHTVGIAAQMWKGSRSGPAPSHCGPSVAARPSESVDSKATIRTEGLAGDEAGGGQCQEDDGGRDFVRLCWAS